MRYKKSMLSVLCALGLLAAAAGARQKVGASPARR